MSGRGAKAARRATLSRYATVTTSTPVILDEDDVIDRFTAAGGRDVAVPRSPLDIRAGLGRKTWGPPVRHGDGWRFQRFDDTGVVLVTAACWPELPDVPVIHASMSRHQPAATPSYEDLQTLHRAVWPAGNAIQCFVPDDDHVNIRANVLHLWGRADNERLWQIDFGRFGTI